MTKNKILRVRTCSTQMSQPFSLYTNDFTPGLGIAIVSIGNDAAFFTSEFLITGRDEQWQFRCIPRRCIGLVSAARLFLGTTN